MVHAFLLAADLQQNLGLMNGKMGMIIWLLKLNSRNPNLLYEDFAFDQLEDIDCKISQNVFTIPIGLYDGLCGIGWGDGIFDQGASDES